MKDPLYSHMAVCIGPGVATYSLFCHLIAATGDCILSTAYHSGGFNDENNRWLTECNDGEGMIGYEGYYRSMETLCYSQYEGKNKILVLASLNWA